MQALDAGFDPFTPDPTWFRGPLASYLGPIPVAVQPKLELGIQIFGRQGITVHDPRPDRFQPALDPIATGDVLVGQQAHLFLVAQWDLDQDIKYLQQREGAEENIHDQIFSSLKKHSDQISAELSSSNDAHYDPSQFPSIGN